MTRKALTYLLALFALASCGKDEPVAYSIKGKVGYEHGKIIVYGLNNKFEKIDSIRTDRHGKFTYTIAEDTVVPFSLFLPDGEQITLFAERGIKAELYYDSMAQRPWTVKGGPVQDLHDSISEMIDNCSDLTERTRIIEEFIKENHMSEIGIELIRRYLVDMPGQDNSKIKSTISKLSGILQDYEYVAILKDKISGRSHNTLHKLFPSFKYAEADSGRSITQETFKKKYQLITFWAPWDKTSRNGMKRLATLKENIKSKNFEILNIALDHDTTAWKNILKEDSIVGHNVCDELAWNCEIASKFDIDSLPYSILVNPYQRIIRYKVDPQQDFMLIDSLTKKYDNSEKERKKREELEKNRKKDKRK